MNAGIQFRDLRADQDSGLAEVIYHEILEPSFDANELETLDSFLHGLTAGGSYATWGLCAMDGDTPVGCVMGYPCPESRVLLIGYVAVRSGHRDRRMGGLLLDEAERRWYGKADLTLVVAEIDDPRHHLAAGDIDPERRVAFYARRGAQVVVGPYFQPRLAGEGKKRVYGIFLAVLSGSNGTVSAGPSVSARQIAAFLQEYFGGEERDCSRDEDAERRWLLDWYQGRETIRLHPIGRYAEIEIPQVPGRPAH